MIIILTIFKIHVHDLNKMTIQKDAGELLVYIYNNKINGKKLPPQQELIRITKWHENRVIFALEYLKRKGLVYGEIDKTDFGDRLETNVFVVDISPEGIDTLEDPEKFKRNFGFEVNLGLLKFSWGASEK